MFTNLVPPRALHTLAIIAQLPDVPSVSDAVLAREMPLHQASLIVIVALFIIAWTTLIDTPPQNAAKPNRARVRS
jgi:hypothetical protein